MKERLDDEIISMLKKDSRTANWRIAQKLKISEGTVRYRINRMLGSGKIRRFTIEEGTNRIGALVLVKTFKSSAKTAKQISTSLEVAHIYELSGNEDIALIISANSIDEINSIVDEMRAMNGVKETETKIILKSW